jgi:hypothetical protein
MSSYGRILADGWRTSTTCCGDGAKPTREPLTLIRIFDLLRRRGYEVATILLRTLSVALPPILM